MYQANWDAMDKLIERWRPKAASAVTQIKKLKERIDVLEEELEVILMERIRDKSNAERYERMIHKREKKKSRRQKKADRGSAKHGGCPAGSADKAETGYQPNR